MSYGDWKQTFVSPVVVTMTIVIVCLSQGVLQAKSICPGVALQADVSVLWSSQGKSVCPRGALQAEVSVPGCLQAKLSVLE